MDRIDTVGLILTLAGAFLLGQFVFDLGLEGLSLIFVLLGFGFLMGSGILFLKKRFPFSRS